MRVASPKYKPGTMRRWIEEGNNEVKNNMVVKGGPTGAGDILARHLLERSGTVGARDCGWVGGYSAPQIMVGIVGWEGLCCPAGEVWWGLCFSVTGANVEYSVE